MSTTITPNHLSRLLNENPDTALLDVRTPMEFESVHVTGAKLITLASVSRTKVEHLFPKHASNPVYVICKSGTRARNAAEKLRQEGMQNLIVVEGGTDACVAAGLPVVRGKQSISLERQVRIAVGGLNLLAAVLALTVNPLFVGLCAFFGAGLLFAGITDWCGMGILLSKMPWNNRPTSQNLPA